MVASLNRPGGNVTGVTSISTALGSKHIELLHEIIPNATRIGLLGNPKNPTGMQGELQIMQPAAARLGLETFILVAGTAEEIDQAFATFTGAELHALVIGQDAFFVARREQIAALALRRRVAAVSASRQQTEAGALLGYGSVDATARQAGVYVGRILKGANPADLPVVQPTRFELAINLKTAKALGVTIPELFLARADKVIEE
jgi:putative ABC transport system substrate-binding protein